MTLGERSNGIAKAVNALLQEEYGVSKTNIKNWCHEYSRECREKAEGNLGEPNEMEVMKENLRLR